MEAKKEKKSFFKRNIYYFVVAFVLITAITLTIVLSLTAGKNKNGILNSENDNQLEVESVPDDNSSEIKPDDNDNGQGQDVDKEDENNQPDKPVEVIVTFAHPCKNAKVLCDYTATSLVYNQTLNIYTGHMAIDFGAPMGSDVTAVYDGVVESVETSYLKGTTVTIDHGNNLKTIYNSIDVKENIKSGVKVAKGDVIGGVSDNNKQEYKDGPHLHFEVLENGKKISPYKYLTVAEK